jgi:hypothetical protein
MRTIRIAACAAALGAVTACAGRGAQTGAFTISGTYAIYGEIGTQFVVTRAGCTGAGAARSIGDGTPVTVTDSRDIALATGALRGGRFNRTPAAGLDTGRQGVCSFRLEVAHVADGRAYYRLVIAGRRAEQLSNAQAHRRLALTFYPQ